MTSVNEIFKTKDINPTDPLKNRKIGTINVLKAGFKRNFIKNPPTAYHPSHLY
jgi:hypothetical protein